MQINLLSFGYKHGLPHEIDLLFDVRFLPNPYYVPDLQRQTGLNHDAAAYVLDNKKGREFIALLRQMLAFLIPQYQQDGRTDLTISIGCTGGKHRSVAVTEALRRQLDAVKAPINVTHRDIDKK